MKKFGFKPNFQTLNKYRHAVKSMSTEERNDYFFLAANDRYFKPDVSPVGKNVNIKLESDKPGLDTFTQIDLEDKIGYLLIAAPST